MPDLWLDEKLMLQVLSNLFSSRSGVGVCQYPERPGRFWETFVRS